MTDQSNGFRLQRQIVRTFCASTTIFGAAIAEGAYAADECGPALGVPATATCTTAGNPYPGGIHYAAGAGDLLLNIDPGVVVDITGLGLGSGISAQNPVGSATILAPNVVIDMTNDPTTAVHNGLIAITDGVGNAVINAAGSVDVTGSTDNLSVSVFAYGSGIASVTWSGPVSVTGGSSAGVYAATFGGGDAIIDAAGDITGAVTAPNLYVGGIFASPVGAGDALVHYHSGTVDVTGPFAYGVAATSYGSGSAQVITDPGTVILVTGVPDANQNGYVAVNARTFGGSAAAGNFVLADIASLIETTGGAVPNPTAAFNPIGIRARAEGDVPVTVHYTGPGITTSGGGGVGIYAVSGSGAVVVDSSGPITTSGTIAHGIFASTGIAPRATVSELVFPVLIPLEGTESTAVGVGGSLLVTSTDNISTDGVEAHGIFAASASGPVTVNTDNISAIGEFSAGVIATGNSVEVNVAQGAIIRGGWQLNPNEIGETLGLPSAGVIIGSAAPPPPPPALEISEVGIAAVVPSATINIDGTVGALSDRAITEAELFDTRFTAETLTINNGGTVIGYLQLGSGNARFNNNSFNSFDLRDFEDTNGNGIRDTERVAVSNFGDGVDQFDNNATGAVRLLNVFGAIHFDATKEIRPGGFFIHSILLPGVEQGQMINLERFENRGLITMQDLETGGILPIAGDVLVITASNEPGFSGGGVFLSDGGALHLDTVLNRGDDASISDILVVDGTEVGPGRATRIGIENAFGLGAITPGDGIKVVDVLGPPRPDMVGVPGSAPDAFVLEGRAAAGPYEYFLFQGGRTDPNDGDWYLRTGALRPEIPAYLGNADAAISMLVHTLHERLGEPQFAEDSPTRGRPLYSAWLRTVGQWSNADGHGFGQDTDTWLIQGGLEIADAAMFDGPSRLHGGMMAGYGEGSTSASAIDNPNRAHGDTKGTSFGLYATWYANDANRLGLYLDTWAQVGLFDNTVSATAEPDVGYDADLWLVSLEAGYPFMLGWDRWALEPQGQIVFFDYIQDTVFDRTRTSIDGDQDGWLSRLGARTFGMWADADARKYQPYFELNWWHGFDETSVAFNGIGFSSGLPSDRYEVGAGVNVEITRTVTLWANGEYQWGDNWDGAQALAGVKAAW